MTPSTDAPALRCRYVGCDRPVSPTRPQDPTAGWTLCAVHRPFVREALAPGSRSGPRALAVREVEVAPGDVRLLVGPA